MFKLAQIYEEAKYDLQDLLRLHRIFKQLSVEEHDIRNVFQPIKEHQLEKLQGKVEYHIRPFRFTGIPLSSH